MDSQSLKMLSEKNVFINYFENTQTNKICEKMDFICEKKMPVWEAIVKI